MKIVDVECYLNARTDIENITKIQESAGVDIAVLMPPPLIYPDNESIFLTTKDTDRYIKFASINPKLGDEAMKELEKAVKEWGFRGMKLTPPKHGFQIAEKLVYPFLEKAQELGIVVTIHSGQEQCNPGDIGFVALEFPELPIIMDHMGYRYQVREAILASKHNPNLFLATTAVPEPRFISEAVEVLGPEKLLFGSNCPLIPPDIQIEVIKRAGLKKDILDMVLGGNALRIFDME